MKKILWSLLLGLWTLTGLQAEEKTVQVCVAAYNVACGQWATPEEIAAQLRPISPDLVMMNEVPRANDGKATPEWAKAVANQLGLPHVAVGTISSANHKAPKWGDKTGNYGGKFKAILSRFPLQNLTDQPLEGHGWQPASAIRVTTTIAGYSVALYSLHIPGSSNWLSSTHAHLAAQLLRRDPQGLVLLGGDFNMLGQSSTMRQMQDAGQLENASTQRAIDHIFYRKAPGIRVINSGMQPWNWKQKTQRFSDHPFVYANFEFKPGCPEPKVHGNVTPFIHAVLAERVRLETAESTPASALLSATLVNPTSTSLHYRFGWEMLRGWSITPAEKSITVHPGKTESISFAVKRIGRAGASAPTCTLSLRDARQDNPGVSVVHRTDRQLRSIGRPTVTVAASLPGAIVIDGRLGTSEWPAPVSELSFTQGHGEPVRAPTELSFAYDQENLYLALTCHDPKKFGVKTNSSSRDDPQIWRDDVIEFFLDTNCDRRTYAHFIVNAQGVLYDALVFDRSYESGATFKTGKTSNSWVLEGKIPWKGLKINSLQNVKNMGFLVARNSPRYGRAQLPTQFGPTHQPKMFGDLVLSASLK